MIPYYKILDNPEEHSFFLKDLSPQEYHYVSGVTLPDSFYLKTAELFKKSKLILLLAVQTTFENFPDVEGEKWYNLGLLTSYIDNHLHYFLDGLGSIVLSTQKEDSFWDTCCILARDLQEFFPKYKEELQDIYDSSKEIMRDVNRYTRIKLEPKRFIDINSRNAWFITPSNYLYNSGGENGHKGGNLTHDWWALCKTAERKIVPNIPIFNYFNEKADKILEQGYVSEPEVLAYGNYWGRLLSIDTRETDFERFREEEFRKAMKKNEAEHGGVFDFEEYIDFRNNYFHGDEPTPVRSYQRSLITIITGYYITKHDWFDALSKINGSKNDEILNELIKRTHTSKTDFLIRFCGFSKVESTVPKTITTSRLNVYHDFYEYLDRGWNIRLLPPLIYDTENDCIVELDLHSPMIEHFLASEEEKYPELKEKGKGKVLITPPRTVPLYPITEGIEKEFINAVLSHELGSLKEIKYTRSVTEENAKPQEYRNDKYTYDTYNVDGISKAVCMGKSSSGKEFISIKVNNRLYYMEKTPTNYQSADRSISVIENGIEKKIRAGLNPRLNYSLTTEVGVIHHTTNTSEETGIAYCEEDGIFGIKVGSSGLEDIEPLPLTIESYKEMCDELLKGGSPHLEAIFDKVFPFFTEGYKELLLPRDTEDTQPLELSTKKEVKKPEEDLPFGSTDDEGYQELINALYRGKDPNKENYDALYSPEKILVLGANFMS